MAERYWMETLGCPKNQVDSDKLAGTLAADGFEPAASVAEADLVVVNTCAFIEAARQESVDTILELSDARRDGARLVVTGCLAERHGSELAAALPEVDLVAGFGVALDGGAGRRLAGDRSGLRWRGEGTPAPTVAPSTPVALRTVPDFDLLNLPRPPVASPWAYVKAAEGCDRRCGFCAIPTFRGPQRSRSAASILAEVDALGDQVREVVLVAQDLASWGLDRTGGARLEAAPAVAGGDTARHRRARQGPRPLADLVRQVAARVARVRLLYLYPSSLDDDLIEAIVDTGVPYFDLSLQHVSRPLVRRMRRWGDAERFLDRIGRIRSAVPDAAFRSSFILGYPGETEEDHDALLGFIAEANLDWAGFFTFSEEVGTHAATLDGAVPPELALERLRECAEAQDRITEARRRALVGQPIDVLVDAPGVARSYREAPDIDGVVHVPTSLAVGTVVDVVVSGAAGPDLWAEPATPPADPDRNPATTNPATTEPVAAVQ